MIVRTAKMDDLPQLVKIGEECYPLEETITKSEYEKRLNTYANHFWILEKEKEIVAFITGPVINESRITDDMFHDTTFHHEDGRWQAILDVNTAPKHQKKGYASQIMKQLISDVRKQGRKGCVLTCKEELISYYQKFGFKNLGISQSTVAGETWYDMVLIF